MLIFMTHVLLPMFLLVERILTWSQILWQSRWRHCGIFADSYNLERVALLRKPEFQLICREMLSKLWYRWYCV